MPGKHFGYTILLTVFLANFFFEENHVYLIKRIFYSIFIYLAIYQVGYHYIKFAVTKHELTVSPYFNIYAFLFLACIILLLIQDFCNPRLNLVTLFNNPYALLMTAPILIFSIGAHTDDLRPIFNLLFAICVVFLLMWIIKLPGRIPFYEGIVACNAVIPLFILSVVENKKKSSAFSLIILAILFSFISDQRIILLRIILFLSLFAGLKTVKHNTFLKLLIMVAGCLTIFFIINNLGTILADLRTLIGKTNYDSNDTRSFIYLEFFSDFKTKDLLAGRGFLGTYFSPYFLQLLQKSDDSGDYYSRFSVEVGYLELLLKGGFPLYFFFTLPLWYISLKSIFWHSNVKISFYIGIFIFTELLLMFIGNMPYFGFQFSVLFFFAGYAYQKIRQVKHVDSSKKMQFH